MTEKITKERLCSLLENSRHSELAKKYLAWSKLEKDDEMILTRCGSVAVGPKHNERYPSGENYWSLKYPIALEYYANSGCEIFTDGNAYFHVYRDFGGHASEKRCRVITKELME